LLASRLSSGDDKRQKSFLNFAATRRDIFSATAAAEKNVLCCPILRRLQIETGATKIRKLSHSELKWSDLIMHVYN
jgi:hypothetical protein